MTLLETISGTFRIFFHLGYFIISISLVFYLFQNGMEFVLVYCDDPQTYLPSYLVDMITSSGKSSKVFLPTYTVTAWAGVGGTLDVPEKSRF